MIFASWKFSTSVPPYINVLDRKIVMLKASKNEDCRWGAILRTIPDLLFLVDKNGRYLPFIEQEKANLAFAPEDFTGKTFHELFDRATADMFLSAVRETLLTGTFEHEYQMNYTGLKYYSARYARVNDKEVICSVREITAQKETELKLRQAIENQHKFWTIIAHDLRGPVSNFIPILDILTQEELDEESRNDYLEELKKASVSTYNLLENLLSWSRLKSSSLKFTPTHFIINPLIADNLELINSGARHKSILVTLSSRELFPVYADRNSINLVLRNLLNNALKFTSRFGKITVSVSRHGSDVRIQVADTGVGIPTEMTEKIFDHNAFYTTYGTEHEKGSGLGLILAREFLEKNGGTIGVDSVKDQGSNFWFTLPAGDAAACDPAEQRQMNLHAGPWLTGKRILLVDDDLFSQNYGRSILTTWHTVVDTASDGEEALTMMQTNTYDIILMDIEMPVLSGIEAIRIIRERLGLKIPVLALSASISDLTITEAIRVGFNDFLVKPVKSGELLAALARYVKNTPAIEDNNTPYSDTTKLSRALGNDAALVREMVASFLKITPAYFEELTSAHASGDLVKVKKTSHKLRSSVALLAVIEPVANLDQINAAAGDPLRHEELVPLIKFLKIWYPRLCKELHLFNNLS